METLDADSDDRGSQVRAAAVIVLGAPQEHVEQHALQLVRRHALRAMDAWHLAAAGWNHPRKRVTPTATMSRWA